MKRVFATLVVTFVLLTGISAMAATLVLGTPADTMTGNCFPFGCAYSGEYQQVYTSSLFSGPISITALSFYNTVALNGNTALNSGNWVISLSTTSADWNSLSATYASNLGGNNTTVFSGNLAQPWANGDTLTIDLTAPFTYYPGQGNLLMDVVVTGASIVDGPTYFDTNGFNNGNFNGNTIFGRTYCNCGVSPSGSVDDGYGLVTGITGSAPTVPEPGSLVLLGSGLLGVAGVVRRKLKV